MFLLLVDLKPFCGGIATTQLLQIRIVTAGAPPDFHNMHEEPTSDRASLPIGQLAASNVPDLQALLSGV